MKEKDTSVSYVYNENIHCIFVKVDVVYSLSRTLLKVKNQRRKKQKHNRRLHKSKMQKKRKKKFRKKARTNQMTFGNEKGPATEHIEKNAKKPRKGRKKGEYVSTFESLLSNPNKVATPC